jgi:hypothetical protein
MPEKRRTPGRGAHPTRESATAHAPHPLVGESLRQWLRLLGTATFLALFLLQSACLRPGTGHPPGGHVVASSFRYRPLTPPEHPDTRERRARALAAAESFVESGEGGSHLVSLSLPTGFGAVAVGDSELHEAFVTLVLSMPMRVASSRPFPQANRLYLHASAPSLSGPQWRSPLAQRYGGFCEGRGTPGDCLELFEDGPGLDDRDKRDIALALAVNSALEARDEQLRAMFSTTQLWTSLSITLIGYMALIAAPEPVSKGVATALTLLLWGYLGWELFDLVRAWFRLWEEASEATTFEELRAAGKRFGRVIGPNSMRILLMLGTAAVGSTASLLSKAPSLPGFAQAASAAESHGGVRNLLTAARQADQVKVLVAVEQGSFNVVLPANALSMAARSSHAHVSSPPPRKPDEHHIATVENSKSTARGGPWTQRFKAIFDKAGMSMEDPANKVSLPGHRGPHPQEYHEIVFQRLSEATRHCSTRQECAVALRAALKELAAEISQNGSRLNRLLTGTPYP